LYTRGEEVVVLIGITKMYIGIPKNYMLVIVVECILVDRKIIPPVIIILRVMIIASWFSKNITSYKLITISELGYTNEGICMA
jgi:hypothetical protein